MKRITIFVLAALFTLSLYAQKSPFELSWDKSKLEIEAGKQFSLLVTIRVPPEHFIYQDKTDLEFMSLEGVRIDDIKFPPSVTKHDIFFGKEMKVYESDVNIEIKGHAPEGMSLGEKEIVARLEFQGCTPKLCLRPEEHEVTFTLSVSAGPEAAKAEPAGEALLGAESPTQKSPTHKFWDLIKSYDLSLIKSRGSIITILAVFLAGVLVSFTPCVWPMIPVVLLIIGVEAQKKWWRNLFLSGALVLGIVLVNTGLGVMAVSFGKSIGFLFQQRWFLLLVIAFFITMSFSMLGFFKSGPLGPFEFSPFKFLQNRINSLGRKGIFGAFLTGAGVGLIASPCSSPVQIALLGYAAAERGNPLSYLLLLIFGLGMGLFFVVIGTGFGIFYGRLKSGPWMNLVKKLLGILLLIPAIFYIKSFVHSFQGPYVSKADSIRIAWISSLEDGLKFARDSQRPVILDFYADWCPPCHELEKGFFEREDIVRLSYQMVPIRIDATVETNDVETAIAAYRVIGWPSVYFLSPTGEIYEDLTVISYDPAKIEAGMREAIRRGGPGPDLPARPWQ